MGNAPGRVMGIDFGTRHIGVAVSDELRVIARGIETVNWNGEDPEWALNRICEIIKEMDVKAIVLGRPARTDGTRSETQDKAEAFGKSLAERCGIEPVFFLGDVINFESGFFQLFCDFGFASATSKNFVEARCFFKTFLTKLAVSA